MFRQASSTRTPNHFLQGLHQRRVVYNDYNGLVSALGRKQQTSLKRCRGSAVLLKYMNQDWQFRLYNIGQNQVTYYRLPTICKQYTIQHYIAVSPNMYTFWMRKIQTPNKKQQQTSKQQQKLIFLCMPKIPQQSEQIQQKIIKQLIFYKEYSLQVCSVQDKIINDQDFFTQIRQLSYVSPLKCLRLVWKFSNKQGGVFLNNLIHGPAGIKPRSIIRVQYIQINMTNNHKQQQIKIQLGKSWTFYSGFRNLYGSLLIIDPKQICNKSYQSPEMPGQQNHPLSIYKPMIIVYHSICQIPQHMMDNENPKKISFIIFIMNQKKFIWPNFKYVQDVPVNNYQLGLDGNDQNQDNNDVNQVLTSIALQSQATNITQQINQQNTQKQIKLIGITMHNKKYRILRITIDIQQSTAAVTNYTQYNFKNTIDRIISTYNIKGYIVNCICQSLYLCMHKTTQQPQQIHSYDDIQQQKNYIKQCVRVGNRYHVEQNVIYLYGYNYNTNKYDIINNFTIPNSTEYSQLSIHIDQANNFRILHQVRQQPQVKNAKYQNNSDRYINITELVNKKLLYMKMIQEIFDKNAQGNHQNTIFIQNIGKNMLQLL